MLALFAVGFMLPFYFEELRGFSAMESGLLLTPLPLAIGLVAPVSGALADRFGSRWLASSGLAVSCVGLVLLARLDQTSTVGDIVWRLALTGVGQGLFQTPNVRALMNAAPGGETGEASSLYATGRAIGQGLSVALAGAVFAGLGGAAAGRALTVATRNGAVSATDIVAAQQAFVTGFRGALLVCAAVAAVGVVVALTRRDERPEGRSAKTVVDEGASLRSATEGAAPK
jgi:MFS family permease